MRVPLPPLEELAEHPIGRRDGQSLYLCRVTSTAKFLEIERSEVFSEHYGEEVRTHHPRPAGAASALR